MRVTVMGLGRFGGGVGVTRFLCDRGADVLVTDQEPADKLEKSIAQLQDLIDAGRVALRLGEHNVSDFTTCDLVVVNPAVKPGNRFVRAAEAAGIEVTTEMRLLVERLPNRLRTIGVTGSAGKSTVTAMIGHVLNKVFGDLGVGDSDLVHGNQSPKSQPPNPNSPKVWVGGNIGGSLLPHIDEIGEDDWVVLELSSFMLERLKADDYFPGWSPHIAVITNISPNHLDWHGSMEAYVAAKQVIGQYQHEGDWFIHGPGVENTQLSNARVWPVDKDTKAIEAMGLSIVGAHNQLNACTAAWTVYHATGMTYLLCVKEIAVFPGLPHRLQLVAERDGVRYFNDSKCTTPEAAKLAIEAFAEEEKGVGRHFSVDDRRSIEGLSEKNDSRPLFLHLVLGGYDKGSDLASLAELAAGTCKAVYTIGQTGDAIAGLCEGARPAEAGRPESCGGVSWPAESAEVVRCGDLETAVAEISKRVRPGDVVLLSPACASWGQFENYEQRGERFIELVNQSIDEPRP